MKNDQVHLISVPCVFKYVGKRKARKLYWFLIKNDETGEWEIPKVDTRKGESSVRASLRAMAEIGGMRVKALEEVGRSGGAAKVNGKIVTQRTLYYLMVYKEGGEVLGYEESEWLDHTKALRRVTSKRDNTMLKDAKSLIGRLEAENGKRYKTA